MMKKLFNTNTEKVIEVETRYVKGRGYVVSAIPVTIKQERGYTSREYDLMDMGNHTLVLQVNRASKKREAEADRIAEGMALELAQEVAKEKGLALV